MAKPSVSFAATPDGQRIAYTEEGQGAPYVIVAAVGNVQANRDLHAWNVLADSLSPGHRVLFIDLRGQGLSSAPEALDLDGWVTDIAAVLDAAGIGRTVLHGSLHGCPAVIAFAARYPDRVERLILSAPYPDGSVLTEKVAVASVRNLQQLDPDAWFGIFTSLFDFPEEERPVWAAMLDQWEMDRRSAFGALTNRFDLRPELQQLAMPTLVLAYAQGGFGVDLATATAAHVGGSSLLVLSHLWRQPEETAEAALNFLGEEAPPLLQEEPSSSIRTVLFTDVEASTDLTDRFGDAKARDLLREHEGLTREALAQHGGTEIKTMGDGFMASFTSASGALDAAIAMQRSITDHFAEMETPIRIRVGINAGEPIEEDDDLYGTAVIQAARVMGLADGGQILVTDTVRNLVAGKDYRFHDQGTHDLKGFEEPARLFEVGWNAS